MHIDVVLYHCFSYLYCIHRFTTATLSQEASWDKVAAVVVGIQG